MLMAHPAILRSLLQRYEALETLTQDGTDDAQVHRQLQDTAYTLCVSTGTRDVESALKAARDVLERSFAAADPTLRPAPVTGATAATAATAA
jgi:hypothetical protein